MDSEAELGLEMSIISVIIQEMKNHWSVPQGSVLVEMSDCKLGFTSISSEDCLLNIKSPNVHILNFPRSVYCLIGNSLSLQEPRKLF